MRSYAIGIDVNGNEMKFLESWQTTIDTSFYEIKSLTIYDENNNLRSIMSNFNRLENITIIGGENITTLFIYGNEFKKLDISKLNKLQSIYCDIESEDIIKLPDSNFKLYFL
jgi:hypothetical protein